MSQVIVTKDSYSALRGTSSKQEHRIQTESAFRHWRIAAVSQSRPLAVVASILFFPVVVFWGLLFLMIGVAMSFFTIILRILAGIFGPRSK